MIQSQFFRRHWKFCKRIAQLVHVLIYIGLYYVADVISGTYLWWCKKNCKIKLKQGDIHNITGRSDWSGIRAVPYCLEQKRYSTTCIYSSLFSLHNIICLNIFFLPNKIAFGRRFKTDYVHSQLHNKSIVLAVPNCSFMSIDQYFDWPY